MAVEQVDQEAVEKNEMNEYDRMLAEMNEQTLRRAAEAAKKLAVRAASRVSEDFLLLPTSDENPLPHVPEEEGDNLTPARRLAVAALVSGRTFAAAARSAEVSARTLYNWRQEPAFKAAVERTSRDALAVVVVRVRNVMLRATRVIADAINADGDASSKNAMRVLNSSRLWSVITRPPESAPNE